jgi:hypothetical protein
MLDLIPAVLAVFGWAFFSFWSAIPPGLAVMQLPPVVVILTVTLSYGAGVALVALAGAQLRNRIQRWRGKPTPDESPQPVEDAPVGKMMALVLKAWERFGLVGLALLAPMTVGAQAGAVIGLSFGEHPLRLIISMTLGAAVWSVLITLAVNMGLMAVQ